jgi:hypothetical protein
MSRQARGDAHGTVDDVILRGLEPGQILTGTQDRAALEARVGDLVAATGTT